MSELIVDDCCWMMKETGNDSDNDDVDFAFPVTKPVTDQGNNDNENEIHHDTNIGIDFILLLGWIFVRCFILFLFSF